jgi:hypothetical protein
MSGDPDNLCWTTLTIGSRAFWGAGAYALMARSVANGDSIYRGQQQSSQEVS